jgi:magnesium-transporting ATPase (P-type)
MFEIASALSIAGQALVHLLTLTFAVQGAGKLEKAVSPTLVRPRARIRPKPIPLAPKFSALLAALVASQQTKTVDQSTGLFGRPEFRPNYETNVVFCLSVFQSLVSTIVNHKGAPFYSSVLESRSLCLTAGLAVLCVVACVAETFPLVNAALQLRPWPSRRHKLSLLTIFLLDSSVCFLLEWSLSQLFGRRRQQVVNIKVTRTSVDNTKTAADVEDALLQEEVEENRAILLAMLVVLLKIVMDVVLSGGKVQSS